MRIQYLFYRRAARTQDRDLGEAWAIFVALVLILMLALAVLSGCAVTPVGLAREHQAYRAATNVVYSLQQAVPYVPQAAQPILECLLGAAAAALAAWNTAQHRRIRRLENGGTSNPAPRPPAATP